MCVCGGGGARVRMYVRNVDDCILLSECQILCQMKTFNQCLYNQLSVHATPRRLMLCTCLLLMVSVSLGKLGVSHTLPSVVRSEWVATRVMAQGDRGGHNPRREMVRVLPCILSAFALDITN